MIWTDVLTSHVIYLSTIKQRLGDVFLYLVTNNYVLGINDTAASGENISFYWNGRSLYK